MSEPTHNPAPRDYQDRDIRLKPVVGFLAFCAVFTLLTFVGVTWMFRSFAGKAARQDRPWSEFVGERQLPPAPLLQVTPSADLAEHRAKEDALLLNYAWIDRAQGKVRIPITRAMDRALETGVFSSDPANPGPAAKEAPAGEPAPSTPEATVSPPEPQTH